MLNYAKEKGVAISALTYPEKEKFLKANPMNKGIANNLKNTKVIETVHIQTKKAKRRFGIATEGFSYPDNFDEDNEEIAKLFGDR